MTRLYEKVEIKEEEAKPFAQLKLDRLKKRRPNKVNYILQIEKLWERYAFERTDEALSKLVGALKFTIGKKAEMYEKKWRNKRIGSADFESKFYIELWRICENDKYTQYGTYYFYETFLLAIKRKAIDVVREFANHRQRAFEGGAVSLKQETQHFLASDTDIESEVENRHLVMQVLEDTTLTAQEREVLCAIYDAPDASYSKVAKMVGLTHHQQIKRILERISKKLAQYEG
ncbi:TPA: hypothetical protein ACGN81_004772 [Bacillus cereus]|uniref:hypothetical protein n=1 Tax=Bacillus thuringiensis TaxID=1428 RepID=UPI0037736EFC